MLEILQIFVFSGIGKLLTGLDLDMLASWIFQPICRA